MVEKTNYEDVTLGGGYSSPKHDFSNEFVTGGEAGTNVSAFSAGIDKAQASLAQAAKQVNSAIGYEYGEEFWQDVVDKNYEEYRKFKPTVESYKDIESFGDVMDYVGENLALATPELAVMLLGRVGLVGNAVQYFGDTINQQVEEGLPVNAVRAMFTAGGESLLNLPLTKGMKNILGGLAGTNLTEKAQKNVFADLVRNLTVDGGTNGVAQILRNYGIEGEVSLKDVDEAMVGGLLTTSPIRLAETVVNSKRNALLAERASEEAVNTGDLSQGDGLVKAGLDFMAGTALAPIKRFTEGTEGGAALAKSIENMRTERELMAADWNNQVNQLLDSVKDPDALKDAYARGERDTPQLKQLAGMMENIHLRANSEIGANLKTGFIANYLPTHFDDKTFTPTQVSALKSDYTNWYNAQSLKDGLTDPETANRMIDGFKESLGKSKVEVKMPKATLNENGDVVAGAILDVKSPIKDGQLEKSRLLGFIPQEILNDYATQGAFKEQLLGYGQSAAQRVTYAEQLGKNNERLNGMVAQMAKEGKAKGAPITPREFDIVYKSMDAYQGVHGQFQIDTARKASTAVRSVTNMAALPLTALSSLTEPFNVAIKVGNVRAAQAFAKALGSISRDLISTFTNGIIDKSETNRQLLLTGRSFKNATTALNNRINGEFLSPTVQNLNNAFFHATGQTAINYLVNSMGVHAMQGQVKTDLQTLAGSPNTKAYQLARGRMQDLGVTPAMAAAMRADPDMIRQMEPSMTVRFNRDIALNPEALDKPTWHSTGWGALFSQIKGYPTMFANTVLPKFIPMVDPRGKSKAEVATDLAQFATTTGMILGIGFLQESLKNEVRGGTKSDEEILLKSLTNTLVPIQMSMLADVATGNAIQALAPASVGIIDRQVKKALSGNYEVGDAPILSSFKGVID